MTHILGMQGMGDNVHQRAIVRELMTKQQVYLETPWPSIYHDLRGDDLKLVCKPSVLRTQTKNMEREADLFDYAEAPSGFGDRNIRVWYTGKDVQEGGSVLDAMCKNTGVGNRDFSLPVPDAWKMITMDFLMPWNNGKPLLVYRPLVMRTEWGGCAARNPLIDHYHDIFMSIRDQFYVVSIADLVPNIEWMVSKPIKADLELHRGELGFKTLAGLFARASMVYASPGFAIPLAQAVGTPSICIFGGYENSSSFSGGARLAAYLGIDPEVPCSCWSHKHPCRKAIDVPHAIHRVDDFVRKHAYSAKDSELQPDQLGLALEAVHESQRVGDPDRTDRARAAEGGA